MFKKITLAAIFVTLIYFSACAQRLETQYPETNRNRAEAFYERGATNTYRRSGNYRQQSQEINSDELNTTIPALTEKERAKKIADAVRELGEIDKAAVIISGNTAIIGVKTSVPLPDDELVELKSLVKESVEVTDANIDHITVTTSEDLVERISRMDRAGFSDGSPTLNKEKSDFVPRG
ncbi:MAG: YhcN/YlaJ family sporulation lipoprotein [Clostridiales bacterium]|nr:YhcN/YlaJ family sporulation lipoprotein [Clostridiales bacterium]